MTAALGNQKSFWKYVGIAAIVMLCFYTVALASIASVATRGHR